jgi:hypothetical protein
VTFTRPLVLRSVPFRHLNPAETGSSNRFWLETAEIGHSREKSRCPVRSHFPQTPGRIKTTALPGAECRVVCLRPFYARHHSPLAARWSDTGPILGSEIKNRASVSLLNFRRCHAFCFR